MKAKLFALFTTIALAGCQAGRYIGPSLGISCGYEGAAIGVTLYGENPVTQGKTGLTNSPVQITNGQ